MLYRLGWRVCFVVMFSTSCHAGPISSVQPNSDTANHSASPPARSEPNSNDTKDDETLYYLDLQHQSIEQPLEGNPEVEGSKFVQVEISKVVNPRKYGLGFRVYYQPSENERVYLGSFSLFPADNPGRFIVATQGKVRKEGKIILSLETRVKVEPDSSLKVGVKKIRFTKG